MTTPARGKRGAWWKGFKVKNEYNNDGSNKGNSTKITAQMLPE